MGLFENFPYTNFHRVNLDWLLTEMKRVLAEWEEMEHSFEDLQAAFTDLYNYVQDYFANLDLENEVAVVLAKMLVNGDLDQLMYDTTSQSVTAWLNANVDPVGSAVTVDSSLTIGGSAADAEVVGDRLALLDSIVGLNHITSTNSGHYISGLGTYSSSTAGRMTNSFHVLKGEIVTVDWTAGTTISVAPISSVSGGVYSPRVTNNGGDATLTHFSYQAVEDMDIVVSWISVSNTCTTYHFSVSGVVVDWDNIVDVPALAMGDELPIELTEMTLYRQNGYYKTDGTIFGSTPTYFHCDFTMNANDVIRLHYKDSVTNCAILAYTDENSVFHVVKQGTGGSAAGDLRFTAPGNITAHVSGTGTYYSDYAVYSVITNEIPFLEYQSEMLPPLQAAIEARPPFQYALDKVLCIGDSLTIGVPSDTGSMPNPMKQCYPFYLARMINTTVTNAGVGGITTQNWYNNQYSNYTMTDYNAFIIFLGTNGGLTDTLATDVDPYNDYTQYANTNTGCYCKLIENIKADNPNCLIALVNIWAVGSGTDTTRDVLEQIAAKYNLPLVDTFDLRYAAHPGYHGNINNVHMTKAGYLALAHRICETLKSYYEAHTNAANAGMTL